MAGDLLAGFPVFRFLISRLSGRDLDHTFGPLVQVAGALGVLLWHGAEYGAGGESAPEENSPALFKLAHYRMLRNLGKCCQLW